MDFGKLRGFKKEAATRSDVNNPSSLMTKQNAKSNNANSNNNIEGHSDILEEIRPEITSEGYGLRTPYGTHVNLDFVKYCEELTSGQRSKKSFARPRLRTTSSTAPSKRHVGQSRLSGGLSTENLDFPGSEMYENPNEENSENTLMETRRRLEAFRSFRSKRYKSSADNMLSPPFSHHRNGYGSSGNSREGFGSSNNGQSLGNVSPCSSSSGSGTPISLSGLPSNAQVTPQHLQIVREQMASALVRLRELEEQVKTIPTLQVKISVLKQEKRHLEEELRIREEHNSFTRGSIHGSKRSRKPALFSTSSGVSSSSFQSSLSSPANSPGDLSAHNTSYLHQRTSQDESYRSATPPPPPKRKYRSVAVGDEVPLEEIVCHRKGENDVSGSLRIQTNSKDFSSTVKEIEIDAAFNIFPPPPKDFNDASTSTEFVKISSSSFQTVQTLLNSCSTQTTQAALKDAGCLAKVTEVCDSSCEPITIESRDVAVMTSPPLRKVREQGTSSDDLRLYRDVGVEVQVDQCVASTTTVQPTLASAATSCDGLVQYKEAASGPNYANTVANACVSTDSIFSRDATVSCDIELQKMVKNEATMTSNGRWVAHSSVVNASCGPDHVTSRSASTNTAAIAVRDQETETIQVRRGDRAIQADIHTPVNSVATNTNPVLKYNQSTDCFDIRPVLRHNASNTVATKTASASTQSVSNKANVVDSMVNTDAVRCADAATSTEDFDAKKIDVYVDKVQSLLEEQQTLLAEKYEVFTDEWGGKTDKVSRFVNPVFSKIDEEEEEKDSQASPTDPISASLSLINQKQEESDSSSSSDYDSDSSDLFMRATLRHLPTPECEITLKSIMKKPGSTSRVKKSLRFAEGVKSDDDDTTCSTCSESSSEDEEEEVKELETEKRETGKEELIDEKKEVVEERVEVQEIVVEQVEKEEKVVAVPPSLNQFNYSNEFVKKSSDTDNSNTVDVTLLTQIEVNEAVEEHQNLPRPSVHEDENSDSFNQEVPAKYIFTSQVLDACDVIEKHLRNPKLIDKSSLVVATSIVQREWFRVSAQTESSKRLLDDFVNDLADTSLPVLRKVVNMTDDSSNTVLHYAISHGNIAIVDCLLSIDELDANKTNQAGYTSAMLAALCEVSTDFEQAVFEKLFRRSDVNVHAKEAGQTALMLAVSHGRLRTAQLLLNCGADINARDEDGSTALMCAVEHGQLEAVKLLISRPNCDATIADTDGSTAMSIAMDAGHREIALLLYAQLNFRTPSSEISEILTDGKGLDINSALSRMHK